MAHSDQELVDESETSDAYDSDDSEEDPTFDALAETTRLTFSNLSVNRKVNSRNVKEIDGSKEEEMDVIEMINVPKLDEEDQKSYEAIAKVINGGGVEKLKVDQCKIYLRKHGLRLSGNKGILIQRIKEHIDILNGGAERKYPASTFVLNCKGDACTGDIVMFEQNVYEVFDVASRSANGPPCGTRIVTGRIVNESYGAAKQQHTFTIEVLWSQGERPLPPLHPLLIKGRNLYRLKTMRQKWEDEGEREKILSEKHARGGVARLNREVRIQQKEMRKIQKLNRGARYEHLKRKKEENCEAAHSASMRGEQVINQMNQLAKGTENTRDEQDLVQKTKFYSKSSEMSIQNQPQKFLGNPENISDVQTEGFHQRRPLISTNIFSRGPPYANFQHSSLTQGAFHHHEKPVNYRNEISPVRGHAASYFLNSNHLKGQSEMQTSKENLRCNYVMIPPEEFPRTNCTNRKHEIKIYNSRLSHQIHAAYSQKENYRANTSQPVQRRDGCPQKQTCRYYARGMCHFGERCNYLHELAVNRS